MTPPVRSIRRRILRGFAALLAATVALQTAWMTAEAGRENNEHHDGEMRRASMLLAAGGGRKSKMSDAKGAEEYFAANLYFIAAADGRIVFHSPGAEENPAVRTTRWFAGAVDGFSDFAAPDPTVHDDFLGRAARFLPSAGWRVYVRRLEDGGRAGVAQSLAWRRDILFHALFPLLATALLALPVLAAGLAVIVRRGFAPLSRLARDAAARRGGDFRPLDSAGAPEEVREFADSFNALLSRIGGAFRRERSFAANAAHELRTPLAAIRVHAENALAAGDDAARRRALSGLLAAAERASGTTRQLLDLARAESEVLRGGAGAVSLAALCREAVSQCAENGAAERVALEAADDARVSGAAAALVLILIRNLTENALRHGKGGVWIRAAAKDGGAEVRVRDNGPGFAPDFSPRLLEPFQRGTVGADEEGCGAGLSICAAIAERLGARLEIGNRPDGRGAEALAFFPPQDD